MMGNDRQKQTYTIWYWVMNIPNYCLYKAMAAVPSMKFIFTAVRVELYERARVAV
jgi:hypothetical protein